jgi:hypothetical protein
MAAAVASRPRPAAPPGLAELLDSDDERMRLEPAKAILDRHLGRPEVRLMRRSIDFEYIGTRAGQLLDGMGERKLFLAVYIDCAARASAYCGTEREEAEEVQRVIGSVMPLLGMYAGVEIAKVGLEMEALDWTGVLCVFSE